MFYNWHRYFDPKTCRYTQFDPIGLAGGSNGFTYAYNNPLRYTDPTGLFAPAVIPIVEGIINTIGGLVVLNAANNIASGPQAPANPAAPSADGSSPADTSTSTDSKSCPPNDPCKGLRDQLRKHEQKLREYINNPSGHDNRGFLGQGRDSQIISSRIRSLQRQIENFRKQLEECERRHGKK